MKTTTNICCCLLLCSLSILFSCTKYNDDTSLPLAQNGANMRMLPTKDDFIATFMPGDSLVVRGDTSNGDVTALLHSGYGGVTTPNFPSFTALGEGFGSIDGHDRSIMKFKLRHISDSLRNNPPFIKKAVLYLYQYHRPADQDPYTVRQSTQNSVELHRVADMWDEYTMNWSNQPALAQGSANPLEDMVVIPAVKIPMPRGERDDQVVDITDMVRKIISTDNNQGFMLKLTNESAYSGRAYGSFACPFIKKRPRLVLYF